MMGSSSLLGQEVQAGRHHRPARNSRVPEPLGAQLLQRRHAGVGNNRRQHRTDRASHRIPRIQVTIHLCIPSEFQRKTEQNRSETESFFYFLCNFARRYATSPSLFAVELMNEPLAPRATLDSLTRYYRDGYDAVRRHSPAAYVVMSNRLSSGNATELLQFAGGLRGAVIDVHYYTVFNSMFSNFTVQQNIDFVRTNFSGELAAVTTQNGPLTFVGKRGAPPDPSI